MSYLVEAAGTGQSIAVWDNLYFVRNDNSLAGDAGPLLFLFNCLLKKYDVSRLHLAGKQKSILKS